MHVYLVISVRRTMETLINASRREKNYTACIPRSKHQMSNGNALETQADEKLNYTCMYTSF